MTLRAYCVTCGEPPDHWNVLAFAESRNKARAMCVGYYDDSDEYQYLRARVLRHMDGHPDTPTAPCVMDYPMNEAEKRLIQDSKIYHCPDCGVDFTQRDSCDCPEIIV